MSRHDILIVKDTHRGLLYEDGVLRDVLPAGRHQIPRSRSGPAAFFGARSPRVEVVLVDIRGRDRVVVVPDLLTAEGATISASFVIQYRVVDPRAAVHEVRNYDDRLIGEVQSAARRALRGMSLDEVLASRDEIAEELHRLVVASSSAYGLEVNALDFKDLVLPAEIREALNRVALARRVRLAELAEARALDALDREPEPVEEPDEVEAVVSRINFDRDPETRPSGTTRPLGTGWKIGGPHRAGADGLRINRP